MDNNISIRYVPQREGRPAPVATHYYKGLIRETHFNGNILKVQLYDSDMEPGPTCLFTQKSQAIYLGFFLYPRDHVRIEYRQSSRGFIGMNIDIYGLDNDELEERKQSATFQATAYIKKWKLIEQGHSEEAANRIVELQMGS
jgi:hypothetical protein